MLKKRGFIGIAFHKKSFLYKDDKIIPIRVGASINKNNLKVNKKELEYIEDSTGENISEKNKNYCELTGIYWMLKNINADFYGLMHYRRYLTLEERKIYKIEKFIHIVCKKLYLRPIMKLLNMSELFQIKITDKDIIKNKIKELDRKSVV